MPNNLKYRLCGQTLVLLADRALFWQEAKTLVVADAHFGKAHTFRSAGIPVPPGTTATDLERLSHLVDRWHPQRLLFLGDLIHGPVDAAPDFDRSIAAWRKRYKRLQLLLVTGNHDRRAGALPLAFQFDGIQEQWASRPFCFTHRPQANNRHYGIAGHIHPAVQVSGKGRQRETLACFRFGKQSALLPAFGSFTGRQVIRPASGDRVFVVAEETVLDLSANAL
jgi:DNA ligase-associated metallophosphoesterase